MVHCGDLADVAEDLTQPLADVQQHVSLFLPDLMPALSIIWGTPPRLRRGVRSGRGGMIDNRAATYIQACQVIEMPISGIARRLLCSSEAIAIHLRSTGTGYPPTVAARIRRRGFGKRPKKWSAPESVTGALIQPLERFDTVDEIVSKTLGLRFGGHTVNGWVMDGREMRPIEVVREVNRLLQEKGLPLLRYPGLGA